MRFIYILLFICYVSCYYDEEDEFDERKTKLVERLSYIKPVLRDGYQMVTRHVGIDVYMYRSYRTVSVVFYPVINDIRDARFTFQSEELHLNNIGSCHPKDVIIQIKYGSYPALNPDGYSFPKNFVDPEMRESIHELEMISDGSNITFSITNPRAGVYFAMAYVKWEDPRTQKVEQEGLVANCQTVLYTDLQVKLEESIENIMAFGKLTIDYKTLPKLYKLRAPDGLEPIELNLQITNTTANNSSVIVKVQANAIPMADNLILHCAFAPRFNNEQTVTFIPHPLMYHYIYIDVVEGNTTYIPDCESYALRSDETHMQIVNLMRDEKDKFFAFDYGLPTVDLIDVTSLINITSSDIKLYRFEVNQFVDIGGSLAIEASLMMSIKYYMGYKRELKKGSLLAFTEDNQYFKVVVCLDMYHASVPLESGQCKYNDKIKPALFVLNSTDSDSIYDKVIIPFPDAGLWYLTFRLFCDSVVCPCRTSDNGTKYYVNTKETVDGGNSSVSSFSDIIREGETECNATIVLSISSKSCVSGKCSNNGNCGYNTFSGLVMSFCSCSSGYGGWDCSDDSRIDSQAYLLLSVLLLTLSNLLFIFSIYVATIRLYFVEGVMYAFTMLFSTFYHACDAPIQIAYCIIRGNILQFGDFYCGLMSFWLTLLAMSIIGTRLRAFFQVIGAIVIALLTTWNMHSFVAFLLPVAVGVVILLISWYIDYRKNRFMRYPTSYYTRHMPLGLVLVSIGLICYAFLQTEQNYKIVHSLWHMIIALSVVFLLPDAKRRNCHPFVASREQCSWPLCGSYHRSQSP